MAEGETGPTLKVRRAQGGHRSGYGWQQATEEPCIGSRSATMAQQAAFHFKIFSVNRGDCVAGIPAAPSIPSEVGFTHPHDRGYWKGLAGALWQCLPVFCWKLPPDHVAPVLLGCLVVMLFVLRGGLVSPGWWGGGSGREGPEEKHIIPNPVLVASQIVPGRLGAVSLAQQLSVSTSLRVYAATGDRGQREGPGCLRHEIPVERASQVCVSTYFALQGKRELESV